MENKKGNIVCMFQGGICSLTDCDSIFHHNFICLEIKNVIE